MLKIKQQWFLLVTCAIVLINFEQLGIIAGWTSPILPRLQANDSLIPTSNAEGSWLATTQALSGLFAAPLAALSVQYLGRRLSILLTIIPFLLSSCILALATTVTSLLIARGICGVGVSLSLTVTSIYIGEVSTDNIRGGIGLFMGVFQNIGILRMYIMGAYCDLWVSSLGAVLPLLIIPIFYRWLPESPYFLIMKGRKDEATKVLQKLRNRDDVHYELLQIEKTVAEMGNNNSCKDIVMESCHRRALLITMGVMTIAQLTGGNSLIFYAHLIFQKVDKVSYNSMSITKAVLQLLTSFGSALFVDRIGRKPLLIISCAGSALFMACEGIYFYLHDYGYNVDSIWWLPLFAMIMFNISQVIGLTPISLSLLSELFHLKVKTLGLCINKAYLSIIVFFVGKSFQIFTDSLGNYVPFFFFSIVGLLGIIFTVYVVPETKGKSLDDIQYYLKHKVYPDKNKI